jgi:hypothetical protein
VWVLIASSLINPSAFAPNDNEACNHFSRSICPTRVLASLPLHPVQSRVKEHFFSLKHTHTPMRIFALTFYISSCEAGQRRAAARERNCDTIHPQKNNAQFPLYSVLSVRGGAVPIPRSCRVVSRRDKTFPVSLSGARALSPVNFLSPSLLRPAEGEQRRAGEEEAGHDGRSQPLPAAHAIRHAAEARL